MLKWIQDETHDNIHRLVDHSPRFGDARLLHIRMADPEESPQIHTIVHDGQTENFSYSFTLDMLKEHALITLKVKYEHRMRMIREMLE